MNQWNGGDEFLRRQLPIQFWDSFMKRLCNSHSR